MERGTSPLQSNAKRVRKAYDEDEQEEEVSSVRQCEIRLDYPRADRSLLWDEPVAVCSFHFRYHQNRGKGALKYEPVSCSKILLPAQCDLLRLQRGRGIISFDFKMVLPPACMDYQHKVLAVPSIGCPKLLTDIGFCESLLWAAHARTRPTFLVVHALEVDCYMENVRNTMKACGVGIVSWQCAEGVLGFGVSRLAAQQLGERWGERSEVVMCDVNVVNSDKLASGYDSGEEAKVREKSVRSTTLYIAQGQGSGVPKRTWNKGEMQEIKSAQGGSGRPLEQLVTVGDELLYDPCFITSAEDADMTEAFLYEENFVRDHRKASTTTFRRNPEIEKVELGSDFFTTAYASARDKYLDDLSGEDAVKIIYRKEGSETTTTVGALAKAFADQHGLNANQIRSLIIEKILLLHKGNARLQEEKDLALQQAAVEELASMGHAPKAISERTGINFVKVQLMLAAWKASK